MIDPALGDRLNCPENKVPIFVDAGTVIRVDTGTGEYMDRVKK